MIRIDTIHRIRDLVDSDPVNQSMDELFKSLAEEFGEVARIINGKPHDEDISHELADVIICALSMIYVAQEYPMASALGQEQEDLDEILNQKLDKWQDKQRKASVA